jgi:hypothetical protein
VVAVLIDLSSVVTDDDEPPVWPFTKHDPDVAARLVRLAAEEKGERFCPLRMDSPALPFSRIRDGALESVVVVSLVSVNGPESLRG